MKEWLGGLLLACLLLGCSNPDAGPPLGAFPAIAKTETDEPFTLTAPSSRSPAAFVFTSSNPAVATVVGATVTIRGAGASTITASQPSIGSFGPTSTSTTLTVSAVPCENGGVRVDGVCKVVPTCVSPATVVNYECVAPAASAPSFPANGLIWAAVSVGDNWIHARDYCAGTVIDSVSGWRQPTRLEIQSLVTAGAVDGHGWVAGEAWSADAGASAGTHVVVSLSTGTPAERADTAVAYVSCVHEG